MHDLEELLYTLNQPPKGLETFKLEGTISLSTVHASICYYSGILSIFRNSNNEDGWYSVEKFIDDRDERSPNFSAQFYKISDWSYVPFDPLCSEPSHYMKATVILGSKKSELTAEASLYMKVDYKLFKKDIKYFEKLKEKFP